VPTKHHHSRGRARVIDTSYSSWSPFLLFRTEPGARGCMNAAVNAAANAASKAARTTSLQSPSLARFADTHRRWVQSLAPGCMYIYVITGPWMYGNHVDGCNPIYGNHLPLDICIFMYIHMGRPNVCEKCPAHTGNCFSAMRTMLNTSFSALCESCLS